MEQKKSEFNKVLNAWDVLVIAFGGKHTQLAQHLGVSKGYVSQILNGDYDHRLSKFMELSLAFGYVPRIEFIPIEQVLEEDSHSYVGTPIVEDSLALAHYNNAMGNAYEIYKQVA